MHGPSPGGVSGLGTRAFVQQGDNLPGEAGKVHKDALLIFQALKLLLAHFQSVQKVKVTVAGYMNSQYLQGC